jgi:hypothetical protein
VSKTVFEGPQTFKTSVADTEICFNEGSTARCNVSEILGMTLGENMVKALTLISRLRVMRPNKEFWLARRGRDQEDEQEKYRMMIISTVKMNVDGTHVKFLQVTYKHIFLTLFILVRHTSVSKPFKSKDQ